MNDLLRRVFVAACPVLVAGCSGGGSGTTPPAVVSPSPLAAPATTQVSLTIVRTPSSDARRPQYIPSNGTSATIVASGGGTTLTTNVSLTSCTTTCTAQANVPLGNVAIAVTIFGPGGTPKPVAYVSTSTFVSGPGTLTLTMRAVVDSATATFPTTLTTGTTPTAITLTTRDAYNNVIPLGTPLANSVTFGSTAASVGYTTAASCTTTFNSLPITVQGNLYVCPGATATTSTLTATVATIAGVYTPTGTAPGSVTLNVNTAVGAHLYLTSIGNGIYACDTNTGTAGCALNNNLPALTPGLATNGVTPSQWYAPLQSGGYIVGALLGAGVANATFSTYTFTNFSGNAYDRVACAWTTTSNCYLANSSAGGTFLGFGGFSYGPNNFPGGTTHPDIGVYSNGGNTALLYMQISGGYFQLGFQTPTGFTGSALATAYGTVATAEPTHRIAVSETLNTAYIGRTDGTIDIYSMPLTAAQSPLIAGLTVSTSADPVTAMVVDQTNNVLYLGTLNGKLFRATITNSSCVVGSPVTLAGGGPVNAIAISGSSVYVLANQSYVNKYDSTTLTLQTANFITGSNFGGLVSGP